MSGTYLIALWGATISTILAAIKIWEVWKNRTRIEVSSGFASDPHIGNEVIVRNLGGTPIVITNWELLWVHRRWFRWKEKKPITDQYEVFGDNSDWKLDGHTSGRLEFRDEHYFQVSATGKDQIYIRLHIAGRRRPIPRKVFPPA